MEEDNRNLSTPVAMEVCSPTMARWLSDAGDPLSQNSAADFTEGVLTALRFATYAPKAAQRMLEAYMNTAVYDGYRERVNEHASTLTELWS